MDQLPKDAAAGATDQQMKRRELLEKAAKDANHLIQAYSNQDELLDQAK